MTPQLARVSIGPTEVQVDLSAPHSLARLQDFSDAQPRWFGASPAHSGPLVSGAFSGRVANGASCNCSEWRLTPHGNGTHTEGVGHLTREAVDVCTSAPRGLLAALLLAVAPASAESSGERSDPPPQPGDRLITRASLIAAWPARLPFAPAALVLRTGFAGERDTMPPYLTAEAAHWLVDQDIGHLLLDLPSVDRLEDAGRLTVHRLFFGLPPGSTALADARRPHATITELCSINAELATGAWLLDLQMPALAGDAVPSRPLLYQVRA